MTSSITFVVTALLSVQVLLSGIPLITCLDFGNIYEKLGKMCYQDPKNYIQDSGDGLYCNIEFTGTCWPQVKAGFIVMRTCPKLYFKDNALISRHCTENGVWDTINFSSCVKLSQEEAKQVGLELAKEIDLATNRNPESVSTKQPEDYEREVYVFVICSWIAEAVLFVSLVALSVQKSNNERFYMDRNLVFAFLMRTATFLIDYYTGLSNSTNLKGVCNFFWILNRYFAVAEITWMLNEAIYLLRKISHAFDHNSYHLYFVLFGWGLPFFLTFVVYTPVVHYMNVNEQRCWTHLGQSLEMLVLYVPLTIMLMINFGIMVYVIKVLIHKMREEKYSEAKIVWKSTKGALVLMPSLGFIYLITFYTPVGNVKFDLFVRVLYPMQGVLVCIVNVALNNETHHQFKERWRKWRASKFEVNRPKRHAQTPNLPIIQGMSNPQGIPLEDIPKLMESPQSSQNKTNQERRESSSVRRFTPVSMQDVMAKDEVFSACTHPEAQSLAISPRTPISISLSSSLNSSLADVDNKSTGEGFATIYTEEVTTVGPDVIKYRKVSTV